MAPAYRQHITLSPGALIEDRSGADAYDYCIPKVGGRAVLSSSCRVGADEAISCSGCGKRMSFIASTPTLKTRDHGRESIVYLFGCLEEGCGGSKGSWRVFRWTEAEEEGAAEQRLNKDGGRGDLDQSAPFGSSSWGLDDGDDVGGLDLGDLSAQLQNLIDTGSKDANKSDKKKERQSTMGQQANSKEVFDGRIPAFYLVYSADIPPTMDMDSDDEEEARYGRGMGSRANEEAGGEETDGDEWSGEAYERDAVIRTGNAKGDAENEACFVAYMREIGRVPDQCVRVYGGGGGVPLAWPTKVGVEPRGACPKCGAVRRCAAQIMSPLIVALAEAVEMVDEGRRGGLCRGPESWDWATLAVWVCGGDCIDEGQGLVEEEVVAIGEA